MAQKKINKMFSCLEELTETAPKSCFLGLLLFNSCLNDLFYLSECLKVCIFDDDTTFYVFNEELGSFVN